VSPRVSRVERVVETVQFLQRALTVVVRNLHAGVVILRQQGTRGSETGGDDVEDRTADVVGNLLLQSRHAQPRQLDHGARVRRDRSVQQLEQRALAASIPTEQADTLASLHAEIRVREQFRATEGERDILEAQQRHVGSDWSEQRATPQI